MDEQAEGGDWLRQLAIRVGIYVGTFLAGALIAFLYSYMPLHNAKNWKIDYLEERLAAKDAQVEEVSAKLATLESESAEKPDSQTFKLLQDELASADKTVSNLERKIAKLERRAKEMERSRDKWKARHAEANRAAAASELADVAAPKGEAAAPASPAAPGSPVASGVSVTIGSRWRSPDGRHDFHLVDVDGVRAEIVPDASALRPGAVPETRTLGAGDEFEIGKGSATPLRVKIRSVDADAGIVVDVTD